MAVSAEISDGGHEAVELIVREASASASAPSPDVVSGDAGLPPSEETVPLLKPKIDIFSVSYPRRKPREQVTNLPETDTSSITHFFLWIWSGSRYSGLLCVALSSILSFVMEILSDSFSGPQLGMLDASQDLLFLFRGDGFT